MSAASLIININVNTKIYMRPSCCKIFVMLVRICKLLTQLSNLFLKVNIKLVKSTINNTSTTFD